jgi:site-specific recombinase XerD
MGDTWETTSSGFYRYLITRGRSTDTATTYRFHLHPFWAWCELHDIDACHAERQHVELYLGEQLAALSKSTCHVRLSAIKSFCKYLERDPDPTYGLTVRKEKRQTRPPCTDDDQARLLLACRSEEERLLFMVGFGCGLRISEIVGIDLSHIYLDRILIKGKGSKERWVAPPEYVMKMLHKYMEGRRGKVFPMSRVQARRIMDRIADHAGVKGFYPHKMRITFATRFWRKTHDLLSLRLLLGHADTATTSKYADYDAATEALEMMRRFSETA